MSKQLMILMAVAFVASACGPEFPPYTEISDFRVLAIKAEKPWLPPNEETLLEALVFTEDPGAEVTYQWEWCPITEGASNGHRCVITEEDLQEALSFAAQDPNIPDDITVEPFDLGTGETAVLRYPTNPLVLLAVCEAIYSGLGEDGELPEFVDVPDCVEDGFPITIKLTASSGGLEILSVKEVVLRFDDRDLNTNPDISDVVAKPLCLDGGSKVLCPEDFEGFPLSSSPGSVPFYHDELYRLQLDIPESAIETYTPASESEEDTTCAADADCPDADPVCDTQRMVCVPEAIEEQLAITWFTQRGETEFSRTGYIDGEVTLEEAELNDWQTPERRDFPDETMKLYFVIRDGRGGIDWLEREVRFVSEEEERASQE